MIVEEKRFSLKDGRECLLRSPRPDEAATFIEYLAETSGETDFMVRYPDEVETNPLLEAEKLAKISADERNFMIAAYVDGKLAGNCSASAMGYQRKIRHRAAFGISIYKWAWGLGLGTLLVGELLTQAKKNGFEQVELDVVSVNERARALYKKLGFEEYGVRRHCFKLDNGEYYDLVLMMRVL